MADVPIALPEGGRAFHLTVARREEDGPRRRWRERCAGRCAASRAARTRTRRDLRQVRQRSRASRDEQQSGRAPHATHPARGAPRIRSTARCRRQPHERRRRAKNAVGRWREARSGDAGRAEMRLLQIGGGGRPLRVHVDDHERLPVAELWLGQPQGLDGEVHPRRSRRRSRSQHTPEGLPGGDASGTGRNGSSRSASWRASALASALVVRWCIGHATRGRSRSSSAGPAGWRPSAR